MSIRERSVRRQLLVQGRVADGALDLVEGAHLDLAHALAADAELLGKVLEGGRLVLQAPLRADSEGEWQDWLVDEQDTQEISLAEREELGMRRALLKSAMTNLNERERHILTERRLKDEPTTLEDLSQHYGISRERVRQIEVRAFEKLQKNIKNAAIEQRLAQ